ncbi:flagellar basal body rod protein FlgG [Clostridium paraputrificum]|uniref:Flagellar basal-body rod protein FlgG n=1 Tax=Clostridium paraputrificum TaxID=29363 RepID=A0A6N3GU99_9CLOT
MLRTIWTSKTGLNAQQVKLDTISNNLANSGTMGYKRVDVGFKDLLNESLDRKGYPVNDKDASMGTGVKTTELYRDNAQGFLTDTGLSTDLSIDGEGYFRLVQPDGSYIYTRDGAFQVDSMGRLVDTRGNKVYIEYINGRNEQNTTLNARNLLIDTKGGVYNREGDTFIKIGNIPLYTAVGTNAFQSVGDNLFLPGEDVNIQVSTNAEMYQGFLEGSNVDIATEFTDMIVTQRAFQLSTKAMESADEMWGMINNMRR